MKKVMIQKLYNKNGVEVGAILSVFIKKPTNAVQKDIEEKYLIEYAHNTLYPGQGLNFHKEIHEDAPSIIVIKNINNIDYIEKDI